MLFWEKQKVITTFYTQCKKPVCNKYQLTQMEFDILMFLTNNPEYDTASDIIKIRMLSKSHVSTAIKRLESDGLLKTAFHGSNRKTVHISVTDKAKPIIEAGQAAQQAFVHRLFRGFSAEEFTLCKQLFQRMCHNAHCGITEVQ